MTSSDSVATRQLEPRSAADSRTKCRTPRVSLGAVDRFQRVGTFESGVVLCLVMIFPRIGSDSWKNHDDARDFHAP
jgi:hypothetical protein